MSVTPNLKLLVVEGQEQQQDPKQVVLPRSPSDSFSFAELDDILTDIKGISGAEW